MTDDPRHAFMQKVEFDPSGCWLWKLYVTPKGYPIAKVDGQTGRTHRFAYELFVGAIPDGLEIDHVRERGCRHRHCVNPAHLEAVTPRVNSLRSESFAARNARKTHCPRGHAYSPENTIRRGPNDRQRQCRTCSKPDWERRALTFWSACQAHDRHLENKQRADSTSEQEQPPARHTTQGE